MKLLKRSVTFDKFCDNYSICLICPMYRYRDVILTGNCINGRLFEDYKRRHPDWYELYLKRLEERKKLNET